MVDKHADSMHRATRGLIPLPEGDVPDTLECVTVYVPTGAPYKRELLGVLYTLTHWNAYERDETHKGALVANAWKRAITETAGLLACGEGTEMDVRQNEDYPCILEKDTGEGWTQFADLQLCQPKLRKFGDKIQWQDGAGTWHDYDTDTGDYDPKTDGDIITNPDRADPKCLAAANCENVFYALHKDVCTWYTNNAIAILLMAGCATAFMMFFPAATPGILAALGASLGAGVVAYASYLTLAQYTGPVKNQFLCAIYANTETDGTMTQTGFDNLITQLNGYGGFYTLLAYYVQNAAGLVGMNNALRTTAITQYECCTCNSDCDCGPMVFDFKQGQQGWTNTIGLFTWGAGIKALWDGYEVQVRQRYDCAQAFAANSHVKVTFYLSRSESQTNRFHCLWYNAAGTLLRDEMPTARPSGEQTYTFSLGNITTAVRCDVQLWLSNSSDVIWLRKIEFTE